VYSKEYGFQSLPWFNEFKPLTQPEDWHPFSPFLVHRNHHINGQTEIYTHLQLHFGLPNIIPSNVDCSSSTAMITSDQSSTTTIKPLSAQAFRSYCTLTQVVHAMYLMKQTQHYRRGHWEHQYIYILHRSRNLASRLLVIYHKRMRGNLAATNR
jgi:hypothetical protein